MSRELCYGIFQSFASLELASFLDYGEKAKRNEGYVISPA
jgi:hypothetical protein